MEYLITDLQLTAATGNDKVSGGIGHDALGNMYWGNSTSDDIWMMPFGGNPDTDIASVLTTTNITDVTGATAAGFGDIFPAPDGLVYFYESTSDGIMSFDPANPAGTLGYVLTEAELLDGPMAYDNVFTLGWYDDTLSFHANGERGLYMLPEPGTMLLLSLGGLAVLRRRR